MLNQLLMRSSVHNDRLIPHATHRKKIDEVFHAVVVAYVVIILHASLRPTRAFLLQSVRFQV